MTKQTVGYLGLALVAIAVFIVTLQSGDSLRYSDESDYEQLARSIVHEHEFSYEGHTTMSRPPGYPAVIALVYSVIESPLVAKLANLVFLALAVVVLARLARGIEPQADVLVPYFVLAYPLLIYAASVLYPQILGCLLLAIIVSLVAGDSFTVAKALIAALVYAVLILCIPYFLMLLPLFAIFVCFRDGKPNLRSIQRAAALFATCVLIVGIWTARNFYEFHALVPVSANNGVNLLIGNSAAAKPNTGVKADLLLQCPAAQQSATEYEFDAVTRKCALDWVFANPSDALQLYALKVLNYFNFRNELTTVNEQAKWREWLIFATYYPLLLLALARAALYRRFPFTKVETLIYVLYFVNAGASAIFFTRLRFRIPFDFLLIGVNAAFLIRLWNLARSTRNAGLRPQGERQPA